MKTAAKQLLFPLLGVQAIKAHHDVETRDGKAYAAPFAMNVRGRCAIERRLRGGSRPGMKTVEGVGQTGVGKWLWPDGTPVLWPDGKEVSFRGEQTYLAPDGSRVIDLHAVPRISASVGNAPVGATVATFYRARVFAAVGTDWFCSRIGDSADWNYGADRDDVARACAGNVALAGKKGDAITAFMPVNDSMLYIATSRSLWCINGDPANGSMVCVSPEIGMSGAAAWCWTGQRLYFLNANGLYAIAPGGQPVHVSYALPFFKGDAGSFIGHDPVEDALHVFTANGDWYVEIMGEAHAFWPMGFATASSPTTAFRMNVGGKDRVAFLCADGKWRVYDDSVACESESRVAIGPFRISASDDTDGFLAELHIATGEGSANVSAVLYTGHSAEAAERAAKNDTGGISTTFISGWNVVWRPRVRGAWAVIVLQCAGGKWAFEAMRAVMRHTGRLRP